MIKINIQFAELHTALFLAGTNLGLKLNLAGGVGHRTGLRLIYDRQEKELLVYWNGEVAIVPTTNVASMTPFIAADVGDVPAVPVAPVVQPAPFIPAPAVQHPKPSKPAPAAVPKASAQVSSPQSHIFEGPGYGKTGQEK